MLCFFMAIKYVEREKGEQPNGTKRKTSENMQNNLMIAGCMVLCSPAEHMK